LVREVAHARKRNPLSDLNKILHSGGIPDVITCANFGEESVKAFSGSGGSNLPFFIDFDRRPYNTLALPCECVSLNITQSHGQKVKGQGHKVT